ncbi:hypothetical protein L0B52_00360 [Suttonella sp. R2A3]|uniref:hypothetical protein n=1 Tax=Suttonella sp. R2A3 TaxID=2908648 RepID=UPI001F483D7C|nr:hypothetical protein [Suttonella sp. R2A3]UJF24630.1 hypothetical protein L0B52_00360 [Suttonella sp. R2A3]
MNWGSIGAAAVAVFFIWMIYRNRGGIKEMMQRSKEAPQYWGTFALLMAGVIALVYVLIKL